MFEGSGFDLLRSMRGLESFEREACVGCYKVVSLLEDREPETHLSPISTPSASQN